MNLFTQLGCSVCLDTPGTFGCDPIRPIILQKCFGRHIILVAKGYSGEHPEFKHHSWDHRSVVGEAEASYGGTWLKWTQWWCFIALSIQGSRFTAVAQCLIQRPQLQTNPGSDQDKHLILWSCSWHQLRQKDFTLERSQRSRWAGSKCDCAALPLQLPPARDGALNPSRGEGSVTAMPTASDTANAAQTTPSTAKRVRHISITGLHLKKGALLYHKQNSMGFGKHWTKGNRAKITKPNSSNRLANFSSVCKESCR